MKGAEARIKKVKMLGKILLEKYRIKKDYRNEKLDYKLRKERTKREVKLLHKAKLAGIKTPVVYEVGDVFFKMSWENKRKIELDKKGISIAVRNLAKLHSADIIHGDYTKANILEDGTVIDFGLGFISKRIEDKAIDLLTLLRTLGKEDRKYAEQIYEKNYREGKLIIERVKKIESRMRYN